MPRPVRHAPAARARLEALGVQLMLYPHPTAISFESDVPYVMAVHDLQHRLNPQFPEVSAGGEWRLREYLFRHGCRHATLVLVDSEVGKEDVLACYGRWVDESRVKVLPFVAPPALTTLAPGVPPTVPNPYFFYPAALWPHKNHRRVAEALGLLERRTGVRAHLALSGSARGDLRERTMGEVMNAAAAAGVEDRVHHLGYVPDETLAALYRGAAALVMPTFFGPTNIPIIEAWEQGCPVITSDIRGVREQVGNAALLADPTSVEAIAGAMQTVLEDEPGRAALVERGRERLRAYSFDDFARTLRAVIDEAAARIASGDVRRR